MEIEVKRTTSNKILKSISQQKVMRLIFTNGPIFRVELSEETTIQKSH